MRRRLALPTFDVVMNLNEKKVTLFLRNGQLWSVLVILAFALSGDSPPGSVGIKRPATLAVVRSLNPLNLERQGSDEIVIKLKPGFTLLALRSHTALQLLPSTDHPALTTLGITVLKVLDGKMTEALTELRTLNAIQFVEPNHFVQAAITPNDPYWVDQYGPVQIQAPLAWGITTGSASVTIAIVDTGVDLTHPDLMTKLWNNAKEDPHNGIDDDLDGYVDNWRGWDFLNQDNDPQDDHGHGTHVAGIAAATTHNHLGIAGVAWGARIMPLKVLDSSGNGLESDVAEAIVWATQHGAKIINLSLGGEPASVMEEAVNYAYAHGALMIGAAGNSGLQDVLYPAAYPNALAVAATDANNQRTSFSSYGPEVDLVAPGAGIYSTYWNAGTSSQYARLSGTSMAAPHVAGVAALLTSLPQFDSPDRIRAALEGTALDLGGLCKDIYYGSGLVQAFAALQFIPHQRRNSSCYEYFFPFIGD
jgi:thermitase